MNFREFVNSDKNRVPPSYSKQYEDDYIEEPEELPDDDDLKDEDTDDEEVYYEEPPKVIPNPPIQREYRQPQRVQHRVVRPQPRPQVRTQPRPSAQTTYRPQHTAMPVEQYNRPIQISKKQLAENTIENTANSLSEALKRKVDTIFYRFGIQGLERLDEAILDTIEELQYPEPKPIKKPGVNMRRVPARKVVRKPKPIQLEEVKPAPTYYEPEEEFIEQPEPVYESQEPIEEFVEQEPVEETVEQEPVEETVEQPTETEEPVNENMNIMDLANQLLDIDPEKELKHEAKGSNPVFETPIPTRMAVPAEAQNIPMALEVLPVENKFIQMPDLTATTQEVQTETPVESTAEPVEQKKTRKRTAKKKEIEGTNEEK